MKGEHLIPTTQEPQKARSITIEYPGTLPQALAKNRGAQSHWRYQAKEAKNLREAGLWLILEAMPRRWEPSVGQHTLFSKATILVTQYWCGKAMDVSGLAPASAPLVDAFMDAAVIEDDGPLVVLETRYKHVRVRHREEAKVVVAVTEVLE
jgi:hypothetical protein